MHQFIKKFFLIILLIVFTIIGVGFWLIHLLKEDVLTVQKEKEQALVVLKEKNDQIIQVFQEEKAKEFKRLEQKEKALIKEKEHQIAQLKEQGKKLVEQNQLYSLEIDKKVDQIGRLSVKLDDIEQIIGLKKDEEATLIQRVTLAKLTLAQKMFMLQSIPSGKPLDDIVITSEFGYRKHPVRKIRLFHNGVDLRAKYNTKVYATADGVVSYVQPKNIGQSGRLVRIAHNFGFRTAYAHLNKTNVKIGDVVRKGDVIALSGNSGEGTGPHLHYEIRYANKALNPMDYIHWDLDKYEAIFSKQRRVQWESLVNLINTHHSQMVQP